VRPYPDFAELARHETEGVDYRVHLRHGTSGCAVLAPHGGRIERGTGPIANAIAGQEHGYYCFEGIKPRLKSNRVLHLASDDFDEPRAVALVSRCWRVATIHGAAGNEAAVYAGGLDLELRAAVLQALRRAGFHAADDPSPTRQGRGPTNICNRGRSGRGLQLELTYGLRRALFGEPGEGDRRQPNQRCRELVTVIRGVLAGFSNQAVSSAVASYDRR